MANFGVLLFGFALLTLVSAVTYPQPKRVRCDQLNPGYQCTEATLCKSVALEISSGRNPVICGWRGKVPRVCCRKESEDKTEGFPPKYSWISPKGCGTRQEPTKPSGPAPRPVYEVYRPPQSNDQATGPVYELYRPPQQSGQAPRPVYEIYRPNEQNGALLEGGIGPRRSNRSKRSEPQEDEEPQTFGIAAVGGKAAEQEWPWMVAIYTRSGTSPLCGGVLIDERYILTAAHCFAESSRDPKDYKVAIGKIDLNQNVEKFEVDDVKVHEDYDDRYYYHDIAILRLADSVSHVVPACIPAEDELNPGDKGTLLGWGDLSFGGPSSPVLQEVKDLPLIPTEQCNTQYRRVSRPVLPRGITDAFLCAGLEEGGKDACQGDSGGPLLHQDPGSNAWSAVGIVSFGYGCAEPGFPGVYTKISAHMHWIEDYIEKKESQFDARSSGYTATNWWEHFKSQRKCPFIRTK